MRLNKAEPYNSCFKKSKFHSLHNYWPLTCQSMEHSAETLYRQHTLSIVIKTKYIWQRFHPCKQWQAQWHYTEGCRTLNSNNDDLGCIQDHNSISKCIWYWAASSLKCFLYLFTWMQPRKRDRWRKEKFNYCLVHISISQHEHNTDRRVLRYISTFLEVNILIIFSYYSFLQSSTYRIRYCK